MIRWPLKRPKRFAENCLDLLSARHECARAIFPQDDKDQAATVRALFAESLNGECRLAVSHAVVIETVWVLESSYRISRETLAAGLSDLVRELGVKCDRKVVMLDALRRFGETQLAVVDCVVAAEAAAHGNVLATFDRGIGKSFSDVEIWNPASGVG